MVQGRSGFLVYGIQGSYKSGIRYIYAEIWVYRLFCLQQILDVNIYYAPFNFGYIGEHLGILGTYFRVYWYTTTPPPPRPVPDGCG